MISRNVTLPELGLISSTRAALGAGIGLLLADRLSDEQRRAVGWTLFAVGIISTVPLLAEVLLKEQPAGQRSGDPAWRKEPTTAGASEREPAWGGA